MTDRAYSDLVDQLIAQRRLTLSALTAGQAPDLDLWDAENTTLLTALIALGPAPATERVRSRLERLGQLNTATAEAFAALRERCAHRLGRLSHGQRRLNGYRGALGTARPRGKLAAG